MTDAPLRRRAALTYGDDWTDDYLTWLTVLEDDVIIDEFGYERGEFAVYPEAWASLYEDGLAPRDAWVRRMPDAHKVRAHD